MLLLRLLFLVFLYQEVFSSPIHSLVGNHVGGINLAKIRAQLQLAKLRAKHILGEASPSNDDILGQAAPEFHNDHVPVVEMVHVDHENQEVFPLNSEGEVVAASPMMPAELPPPWLRGQEDSQVMQAVWTNGMLGPDPDHEDIVRLEPRGATFHSHGRGLGHGRGFGRPVSPGFHSQATAVNVNVNQISGAGGHLRPGHGFIGGHGVSHHGALSHGHRGFGRGVRGPSSVQVAQISGHSNLVNQRFRNSEQFERAAEDEQVFNIDGMQVIGSEDLEITEEDTVGSPHKHFKKKYPKRGHGKRGYLREAEYEDEEMNPESQFEYMNEDFSRAANPTHHKFKKYKKFKKGGYSPYGHGYGYGYGREAEEDFDEQGMVEADPQMGFERDADPHHHHHHKGGKRGHGKKHFEEEQTPAVLGEPMEGFFEERLDQNREADPHHGHKRKGHGKKHFGDDGIMQEEVAEQQVLGNEQNFRLAEPKHHRRKKSEEDPVEDPPVTNILGRSEQDLRESTVPFLFDIPKNQNPMNREVFKRSLTSEDLDNILEKEQKMVKNLEANANDDDLLMISYIGDSIINDIKRRKEDLEDSVGGERKKRTIDYENLLENERKMVKNLEISANQDEDILKMSYIGDSILNDIERKTNDLEKDQGIIKTRKKRATVLPLTRLITDPNIELDLPKTIDNFGNIVRSSFESPNAPLYHVRNIVGSSKDAAMATLQIPPQNLLVPSDYSIVKNDDGPQVGAINRQMLETAVKENELTNSPAAQPASPLQSTFDKIGEILRKSVESTQHTVAHIGDTANHAKKAVHASKTALPKLITPLHLTNPLAVKPIPPPKPLIVAPSFLYTKDSAIVGSPLEEPDHYVRMGQIMDAVGVSQPDAPHPGVETILVDPKNGPILIRDSLSLKSPSSPILGATNPNNDQVVSETLRNLEEAKEAVGAHDLKEFINSVKQDIETQNSKTKTKRNSSKDPVVGFSFINNPQLLHPFLNEATKEEREKFLRDNGDEIEPTEPTAEDVGHILGAINPLMFERLFNESLVNKNNEKEVSEDKERTSYIIGDLIKKPYMGYASQDDIDSMHAAYNNEEAAEFMHQLNLEDQGISNGFSSNLEK